MPMRVFPSTAVMRFSLIGFLLSLALGLLSMGFLGIGLYTLVSPILDLNFPDLDSLHGDWVWPALILAGMFWSFGFLLAGWTYLYLARFNWPRAVLVAVYVLILFLWALFIWSLILIGR